MARQTKREEGERAHTLMIHSPRPIELPRPTRLLLADIEASHSCWAAEPALLQPRQQRLLTQLHQCYLLNPPVY